MATTMVKRRLIALATAVAIALAGMGAVAAGEANAEGGVSLGPCQFNTEDCYMK